MSAEEVDRYLEALEEPKRSTLTQLREAIMEILPDADQGIAYGAPAFKNHLSYLPHSGSVFPELREELKGYTTSTGALRFNVDEPLPRPLVEELISVRLRQALPD